MGSALLLAALLACACALNERDKDLLHAASRGHLENLHKHLKDGANPNAKFEHEFISWSALQFAAREGHVEVVKALADRGASMTEFDPSGDNALLMAAREGRENVVDFLLSSGVSPNAVLKPGYATPLYVASRKDNVNVVEKLLKAKADPNVIVGHDGGTCMHAAAREGQAAVLAVLVKYGANIEARDNYQFTPLLVACSGGQTEAVRRLLQLGADVDAKDHLGGTCLFRASQGHHADTVAVVLEHNPNVDHKDVGGRSSSDVASERVQKLIANSQERTRRLETLSQWLAAHNMRDVVDQLKSGGIFSLQQLEATSDEELGRLGIPPRRRQHIHAELRKAEREL